MAVINRYVNPAADAGPTDGTTDALSSGDQTHAYDSLSAWEAAEDGVNLTTVPDQHIVHCATASSTSDTTSTTVSGWTTGAGAYITIQVDTADRHAGVWDATKYNLTVSGANCLLVVEEWVNVYGLQVNADSNTAIRFSGDAGTRQIAYNIVVNSGGRAIYMLTGGTTAANFLIWNNIVYGSSNDCIYFHEGTITGCAYNNTVIYGSGGNAFETDSAGVYIKNCIADGFGNANAFVGTWHADSSANATDGTDDVTGRVGGTHFPGVVDFDFVGGVDYHIGAASDILGDGEDLDADGDGILNVTDDIDGDARDAATPDIGADEFVSAAESSSSSISTSSESSSSISTSSESSSSSSISTSSESSSSSISTSSESSSSSISTSSESSSSISTSSESSSSSISTSSESSSSSISTSSESSSSSISTSSESSSSSSISTSSESSSSSISTSSESSSSSISTSSESSSSSSISTSSESSSSSISTSSESSSSSISTSSESSSSSISTSSESSSSSISTSSESSSSSISTSSESSSSSISTSSESSSSESSSSQSSSSSEFLTDIVIANSIVAITIRATGTVKRMIYDGTDQIHASNLNEPLSRLIFDDGTIRECNGITDVGSDQYRLIYAGTGIETVVEIVPVSKVIESVDTGWFTFKVISISE